MSDNDIADKLNAWFDNRPELTAHLVEWLGRLVGTRGASVDIYLEAVMRTLGPTVVAQTEEIDRLTNDNADLRRQQELRIKQSDSQVADERAMHAQALARLAEQRARVLRSELAVAEVDEALRAAGIEYPLGKRGVEDLGEMVDGQRERAEEAEKVSRKREEYVRTLITNLRTALEPVKDEPDDPNVVDLYIAKAEAILHNVEKELDNA